MSLSRKRIVLILAIIVGIVIISLVVGWFVIVPGIIESEINSALGEVAQKTRRHVEVGDIRLTGLKSINIGTMTVSDVDNPEKTGIRVVDTSVSLSSLPTGKDFSIASIDIAELEITLRREGSSTNFDDILDKLKSAGAESDKAESDSPKPWKRYITPFPSIEIQSFSVAMPTMTVNDDLEIGATSVSNLKISAIDHGGTTYLLSGLLSALLVESGVPSTYETYITGSLMNGKNGSVSISYPQTRAGNSPAIFHHGDIHLKFDEAQFELPSTFSVFNLQLTKGARSLIKTESARVRLMQLPPQKVGGVYFKEIELIAPEIHDILNDDGSQILTWARDLKKQWLPEKSSDTAEAPIKAKSPKDYFFTQRLFIDNGSFEFEDMSAHPLPMFSVKDIDLEIGYRSIRKVLDYRISLESELPLQSSFIFEGQYDDHAEKTDGHFELKSLSGTDVFKQWQTALANRPQGSKIPFYQWVLTHFDLTDANLSGDIKFSAALNRQQFNFEGNAASSGLKLIFNAISQEPVELNGQISYRLNANTHLNHYDLESFEYKAPNGALIDFGLHLKHVDRMVKEKSMKAPIQTQSWQFNVSSNLPKQPMQLLFDALPEALHPELNGIVWQGTLGWEFTANGYLNALSDAQHTFTLTMSPDFGVSSWPANRNLNTLNNGMTHTVVDPNAIESHTIAIPPSIYPVVIQNVPVYTPRNDADSIRMMYPDWVLFDDLNPWLIQLITTTEDGSFFTHKGFSPLQIKAALERNVTNNAFSRGASTISMQLIKNLYFDRTKSISRKFQEMLYTWMMESVLHIPKQRIMELYFNIIEFGPEIYGIEQAAKYYFGKRSADLSLNECAFLMAIIPNPRKGAFYRQQTKLGGIQKTMSFYIQEMYRRKCDPETISKMRARYSKMGQEMPFEPCCPPKDSLQLMLESDTLSFYVPNPNNPAESGYQPDLYTPEGQLLNPNMRKRSCGMHSDDPALEALFEAFSDDTTQSDSIFVPAGE